MQQALGVDRLQDLWAHRTRGWSSSVLEVLDKALMPSTWHRYCQSILHFHNHCWKEGCDFPLDTDQAVPTIANFIKLASSSLQRLASMINGLLVAISAIYKPLGEHLTKDPLIQHLHRALVHLHTQHPMDHSKTFDLLKLVVLL